MPRERAALGRRRREAAETRAAAEERLAEARAHEARLEERSDCVPYSCGDSPAVGVVATACTRGVLRRRSCESPAMTIPVTGFSHVRLTVTDLARSRAFYDALFGWDVAYEVPADADDATREALGFLFGGIVYAFPGGLFGLRPVAAETDAFSEDRVGLDHLSLAVASRADLDAALEALDALGARHGQVKDLGAISILEFRDPDGVALELSAPNGSA